MTSKKWPGAHDSDRAGNTVLAGTLSNTTDTTDLQRYANPPCRIISWRVSKWLTIESLEVKNG